MGRSSPAPGGSSPALTTSDSTSNLSWNVLRRQGTRRTRTRDGEIQLNELLRVIQFYNTDGLGCALATEDGFEPGGSDQECCPHSSDYLGGSDWNIALSELLRVIQFFSTGGYKYCPDDGSEDDYCPAGL